MTDTDRDVTEWSDEALADAVDHVADFLLELSDKLGVNAEPRIGIDRLREAARRLREGADREAQCEKCGSCDVNTRYEEADRFRRTHRCQETNEEHLHRTCRNCGYEWCAALTGQEGEQEAEQWQRMAEESLREWAEENPYDMSTDNEADPEHPSITADPAPEEEPEHEAEVFVRPAEMSAQGKDYQGRCSCGWTSGRFVTKSVVEQKVKEHLHNADRPAPEDADRGEIEIGPEHVEALRNVALRLAQERGDRHTEKAEQVWRGFEKRLWELVDRLTADRLRSRPSSGDGEAGGFVGWVLEACYDGDWKPAGGPYSRSEADQEADRLLTEAGAEKVAFHECHTRSEPRIRAAPPEGEEVGE